MTNCIKKNKSPYFYVRKNTDLTTLKCNKTMYFM